MSALHSSDSRTSALLQEEVRRAVRDVPDFPKPGILFKDITPVLADATLFARVTEEMARPFLGEGVTHVVAIESRGFILGGPVAQRLGAGLVPVRKAGKLPWESVQETYALEYGTDTLEMHRDALGPQSRVLIVDDVLATGGTASAASRLVARHAGSVLGCSFLLSLSSLGGCAVLGAGRCAVVLTV
jgi:adenine phosphoribosyltransferase